MASNLNLFLPLNRHDPTCFIPFLIKTNPDGCRRWNHLVFMCLLCVIPFQGCLSFLLQFLFHITLNTAKLLQQKFRSKIKSLAFRYFFMPSAVFFSHFTSEFFLFAAFGKDVFLRVYTVTKYISTTPVMAKNSSVCSALYISCEYSNGVCVYIVTLGKQINHTSPWREHFSTKGGK